MKKKRIGTVLFLSGLFMMLVIVMKIFHFWYHNDTLTAMQTMKTIPWTYSSILLFYIITMVGGSLMKDK